MLGLAGPVAAVAPTYFFAPVGGWKSDVIASPEGFGFDIPAGATILGVEYRNLPRLGIDGNLDGSVFYLGAIDADPLDGSQWTAFRFGGKV